MAPSATPVEVHAASVYLVDGFFQFEVPHFVHWLGLGEVMSTCDAGLKSAFDPDTGQGEPLDDGTMVEA